MPATIMNPLYRFWSTGREVSVVQVIVFAFVAFEPLAEVDPAEN
jgi:hypothetical protein